MSQQASLMAVEANNNNLKANVEGLNQQMVIKKSMHGQKDYIDKLIVKQRYDRENLYSKLGSSELGGQEYGNEDRYVFTELQEETCFECCNEAFAKQLLATKKGKGFVYFKGRIVCQ